MSPSIEEQIERLKNTIEEMEAQRESLSDEVVDSALAPLQRKLDELVVSLRAQEVHQPTGPTQQRKLVTLLFVDIAGSTSIAQYMDPEDVSEIFDAALNKLAQPIKEHGGRVTRFMGDGFLSVFGAQTAREDDPEQAVLAGLKVIELAGEIAEELERERDIDDFQVRVGVNTGLVLLGGKTEAEDTLMGAAVNLAARLESAAPAGGLLVSHDTYRHIRGVFDVRPWEPLKVKGFDEPVKVYRILRAKPRAFRSYTRGVEGVETLMVGRKTELSYLQDALLGAIEEKFGQIVTITGEAGVGKSRLLYELQNWIELLPPPAVYLFEGRANQEAQGMPYGLLRDLFEFRFQIQEDDRAEAARKKIQAGFAEIFGGSDEGDERRMRAHILGQLLGFDFSASPHLKGVLGDAEQLRNRGLMYLSEYFREICARGPVVILLEDIHWADDSSLDALNWLGERLHRQQLLVVAAARHSLLERRPYWGEGLAYHHRLELEPLSRRESQQLVREILKLADHVPSELSDLLVDGAEGNPFYVEELIKMLVEDAVIVKGEEFWQVHPERLAEIDVPPTLAGVLQARLDSLPLEERTVLQQASVVGRLFWDQVVTHIQVVEGGSPKLVPETLTSLRGREMIYRREASAFEDAREYLFKHDILRDVTYESVLKRFRRVYHGLVADWLISQSSERVGEYSGKIAGHLLQAGRKEQAVVYLLQAGEAALASYANHEAEKYFRQALELSSDRDMRAACLAGLGEALGRQGLREEAIRKMREAVDLYYEMEEYDRVAALYTGLSFVLWHDDYQQAWDACQEGIVRLEEAPGGRPEGPGMAGLLAEAGRMAFFRLQEREKTTELCNQAIKMAEHVGALKAQMEATITLALAIDDPQEGIPILQEVVRICEKHDLLRTAARANNNIGHLYGLSLGLAEPFWRHFMNAAEIYRQIGDMDMMSFSLLSAARGRASSGHLESMEEHMIEFMGQSSAAESQVEKILMNVRVFYLTYRGDWTRALEKTREQLDELHKGGNLQSIAETNLSLAEIILELHRFAGIEDLDEAEAALLENVDIQWQVSRSQLLLVVIAVRKGLLREARKSLAEVPTEHLNKWQEAYRLLAEAEVNMAVESWDQVLSAYQALVDIYRAGGWRWQWARHLIDLGDALVGQDKPGNRDRAEHAYRQSLELFTEMGASGYVEVLEERLGVI